MSYSTCQFFTLRRALVLLPLTEVLQIKIPPLLYLDEPSPNSDLWGAPWAQSTAAMQKQSRKAADVSLLALAVASLIDG